MRKKKLVVEVDNQSSIFGLVSSLRDYKLAWKINQVFKIHLVKMPPLCFQMLTGADLQVINFEYRTEYFKIILIKNRGLEDEAQYLIPELTRFDYFMMIDGVDFFLKENQVKERIKELEGVDYVHLVDTQKLKSRDNFIF